MKPRFPWVLTLLAVPALALLIGLGVWQVQRLQWKEGLIDRAEAAAQAPPAPIAQVLAAPDPEFRKALIVCPGLPTAPYVELQSIQEGQVGTRLISACRPPDMTQAFLIDRGFIPDTVTTRPRVTPSTLPLSLLIEMRRAPPPGLMAAEPSERRFYARDDAAMAAALNMAAPSAFTLFALTSANPEIETLVASAPPAAFANNHLGYALTWFGLAIVLVGFYVAMLRRQLSKTLPQTASRLARGDRKKL